MEQEDKNLLLKDLCARLPYGVNVLVSGSFTTDSIRKKLNANLLFGLQKSVLIIKPYLRSMSNLIGKELDECRATCKHRQKGQSVLDCATPQTIDYLISHHFDFRGLIPMGLALEAPKDMYKTE